MRYYITAEIRLYAEADSKVEGKAMARHAILTDDGHTEILGCDIVCITEDPE